MGSFANKGYLVRSVLVLGLLMMITGCSTPKKAPEAPPAPEAVAFKPTQVSVKQPAITAESTKIGLVISGTVAVCENKQGISFTMNEVHKNAAEEVYTLDIAVTAVDDPKRPCQNSQVRKIKIEVPFHAALYVSKGEHEKRFRFVSSGHGAKELFTVVARGKKSTMIKFEVESVGVN